LEIYKEQITDLLEPTSSNLTTREDLKRGVYVDKLTEQRVWNAADALGVLRKGIHNRHVGATQMNELSSRSHAVFTISIYSDHCHAGVTSTRHARLNVVDLAGSERQHWWADGPASEANRVKEAGAINKSLSALTNVIMSLSRAATKGKKAVGKPFVHYRDSKLTFLLRDSLGGNSKTVMVANISPSALCF
jgi:kinesin family protein 15